MHYKNGREAKAGDPVITKDYNGNIQVGILLDMIPSSTCCNATLNRAAGLFPIGVQTDQCFHAEDGWTALNPPSPPTQPELPQAAPVATADVQAGIPIGG